jgi:hypothetical protein
MLSNNGDASHYFPKNLFLLNPNNEGLLGKSRPLFATFSVTSAMLCLGLAGLLASICFFGIGSTELFTTARLLSAGITVQGEIVAYPPGASTGMAQGFVYPITYRFSPANSSTTVSGQVLVRRDVFDRLKDRAAVTVKYLPGDPSVSILVGVDAERAFESSAFASIAVGFAGLIAAVVYFLPLMRHLWQEQRLRQTGHVLVGQVLYCRRYAPVMMLRPDSAEYDRSVSHNFYVELSYRFKTPQGKEIRGRTRRRRNDLRGTRLPTFGAPVAVLYLSQENHKVL